MRHAYSRRPVTPARRASAAPALHRGPITSADIGSDWGRGGAGNTIRSAEMADPPPFPVYAIPLPERLDGSGSWDVYRSGRNPPMGAYAAGRAAAKAPAADAAADFQSRAPPNPAQTCRAACSPRRLVSRFPEPGGGVGTLHDNWVFAAARHPQARPPALLPPSLVAIPMPGCGLPPELPPGAELLLRPVGPRSFFGIAGLAAHRRLNQPRPPPPLNPVLNPDRRPGHARAGRGRAAGGLQLADLRPGGALCLGFQALGLEGFRGSTRGRGLRGSVGGGVWLSAAATQKEKDPSPSNPSNRPRVLQPLRARRRQVAPLRTALGSGLLRLGAAPGCRVGIYSINCKGGALDSFRTRPLVPCSP